MEGLVIAVNATTMPSDESQYIMVGDDPLWQAFKPRNWRADEDIYFGRIQLSNAALSSSIERQSGGKGYKLKDTIVRSWRYLEEPLDAIASTMRTHTNFPELVQMPRAPLSFGYDQTHPSHDAALTAARLARNAFADFAAFVSLFLTSWRAHGEYMKMVALVSWLSASQGLKWMWVNELLSKTQIGLYSERPRRGFMVDVESPWVPYLAQFARCGVPFWVVCGLGEHKQQAVNPQRWQAMAPWVRGSLEGDMTYRLARWVESAEAKNETPYHQVDLDYFGIGPHPITTLHDIEPTRYVRQAPAPHAIFCDSPSDFFAERRKAWDRISGELDYEDRITREICAQYARYAPALAEWRMYTWIEEGGRWTRRALHKDIRVEEFNASKVENRFFSFEVFEIDLWVGLSGEEADVPTGQEDGHMDVDNDNGCDRNNADTSEKRPYNRMAEEFDPDDESDYGESDDTDGEGKPLYRRKGKNKRIRLNPTPHAPSTSKPSRAHTPPPPAVLRTAPASPKPSRAHPPPTPAEPQAAAAHPPSTALLPSLAASTQAWRSRLQEWFGFTVGTVDKASPLFGALKPGKFDFLTFDASGGKKAVEILGVSASAMESLSPNDLESLVYAMRILINPVLQLGLLPHHFDIASGNTPLNFDKFQIERVLATTLSGETFPRYVVGILGKPLRDQWWVIVVEAATLLLILRNPWTGIMDTARNLARRGIRFHTARYCPAGTVPSNDNPDCPPHPLGTLTESSKFSATSYKLYEEIRDDFLRGPRGHLALKMGGVIARLASGVANVKAAASGPKRGDEAMLRGEIVGVAASGEVLIDDRIEPWEVDKVLGRYARIGKGGETVVSLWPSVRAWNTSALRAGGWSDVAEEWFQQRLTECRGSTPIDLKTSNKWKAPLRKLTLTLTAWNKYQDLARAYVDSRLGPH